MAAKRTKQKHVQITERDNDIIKFLWRWKVVSTNAVALRFFPNATPFAAYARLLKLKRYGFVSFHFIDHSDFGVWSVSKKGFDLIKVRMHDLNDIGFKSEHVYHDFICSALQLGETIVKDPSNARMFSEQQLRRIAPQAWPTWIPKLSGHRPDGYILTSGFTLKQVLAVEVELTLKNKNSYESVANFYDECPVNYVIWLVSSAGVATSILKAFSKFNAKNCGKHIFFQLSDFLEKGWQCRSISTGHAQKTMGSFISHKPLTNPLRSPYTCKTLALLDLRKRPISLNGYGERY